jgi:hypothetical protein
LRNLVKKNQQDIMAKAEQYIDTKLQSCGATATSQDEEE